MLLAAACGSTANQGAQPTYPPAPIEDTPAPTSTAGPTSADAAASGTPAAPQRTTVVARVGEPLALRDDISIRKILETGGGFVRLKRDPSTNTIYYMDGHTNIFRLDLQADPPAGVPIYKAADLGLDDTFVASGMAFSSDGVMYVLGNIADETRTHMLIRKGTPNADGTRTWATLASSEPYQKSNTQFDHVFNGIVVSPDNSYLIVNSGSRTDHGEVQAAKGVFPDTREVPLTASIFRIPTATNDQVLPNDNAKLQELGYVYARGTRNSYDPAFAANGDLFAADNGPDADYPDEFNWLQEGHHYGFPWRLATFDNPQRSPDYDPTKDHRLPPDFFAIQTGSYANDPTYPPPPEGVTFTDPIANVGPDANIVIGDDGREYRASDRGEATHSFTPHRSGLGLNFDTANALGSDLTGDALILSWGAAAGTISDPGRDLVHIKLTKADGQYQAQMTQLVVGFDHPVDGALLGKKMYVLDYNNKGSIWEVTLP
jgi:hypothetical protein